MKKIFLTLLFLSVFIQSAAAQLIMEPSKVKIDVRPGETVVDSITLHNNGQIPIDVNVYWQDFEYIAPFDGKKKFIPSGSSKYSLASWFTSSPNQVTIPPQGKRDVNYTINVPSDANGGSYGVLFFEQGGVKRNDYTGVNIVTRLGALFYVETIDKNKTASIGDVELLESEINGVFSNKGNIFMLPKGIYYVLDQEGLVIDRGELDKIYLPPSEQVNFTVPISNSLKAGEYTIVVTFDLDQGVSLVKEVDIRKDQNAIVNILQVRD